VEVPLKVDGVHDEGRGAWRLKECEAALLRVVIQRFTLVDNVNREQL